ncbi:MAG: CBS domain-containing protein [Hahellaceae bacterium]|nr:CBS domain-containing protein [Hahellaceae bacterium]
MKNLSVADYMSRKFTSFTPDMAVVEAAIKLIKNELLGGPVLDADGKLIGWISEQECLGAVSEVSYYADRVATVADVMRTSVLTASPDDTLLDMASRMREQKPKIYPVLDNSGKVIGVISRRIVLKELCKYISGKS